MYGNILMPVLMNIGNLLYVIVALAGGLLLALGSAKRVTVRHGAVHRRAGAVPRT